MVIAWEVRRWATGGREIAIILLGAGAVMGIGMLRGRGILLLEKIKVSKFVCFLVSWFLGVLAYLFLGFPDSWFLGFLGPKIRRLKVSKFQNAFILLFGRS